MDTSKEAEIARELRTRNLTIKYYRILTIIIIIVMAFVAIYIYHNNQLIKQTISTKELRCIINIDPNSPHTKTQAIACLDSTSQVAK